MSKQNVLVAAIAAFLVPVGVVLFLNQDKLFEKDLSRGRLLYFTSPS